ncbi:hypothetical protein [Actinacidiphila soli]|uniref:hypothetical protein n=1 Tax=Actinacidiphila soli TaxID=2487275 RepID=UPI001F0BD3AF|nr:hypothetical protein [Actinacidiphila soli]
MNHTFGTAAAQLVPLADVNENKVTPGLLGFVIFALIGLALWWLMKNMAKQFKKIDFEEEPEASEASSTDTADTADTADTTGSASAKVGGGAAKGD